MLLSFAHAKSPNQIDRVFTWSQLTYAHVVSIHFTCVKWNVIIATRKTESPSMGVTNELTFKWSNVVILYNKYYWKHRKYCVSIASKECDENVLRSQASKGSHGFFKRIFARAKRWMNLRSPIYRTCWEIKTNASFSYWSEPNRHDLSKFIYCSARTFALQSKWLCRMFRSDHEEHSI